MTFGMEFAVLLNPEIGSCDGPTPLKSSLLGVTLLLRLQTLRGCGGGSAAPSPLSCSVLPMATPAILTGTRRRPVLSFTPASGGGGSDPPRNSRSFIAVVWAVGVTVSVSPLNPLRLALQSQLNPLDPSADRPRMMLNRTNAAAAAACLAAAAFTPAGRASGRTAEVGRRRGRCFRSDLFHFSLLSGHLLGGATEQVWVELRTIPLAWHIYVWELPDMMSENFSDFLAPSPLSTFGSDLFYEIHATSLTMSAFQ